MKMRRHKHFVQVRLWINTCNRYWQRRIDEMLTMSPEEQAASDARHKAWADELFKDIGLGEPAAVKYICERVKDGVAVGEFDTCEEAQGLLNKHHKQKKAKLQVRNSVTGKLVLFEEPEFTLGNIAATA